jgi:anti-sigma-K factor RskA
MVEKCSVSFHLRFDLESYTISQWISWEVNSSSVSEPILAVAVFAHPESDVVLVGVSSISWHQTEISMVDNSLSSEENLLIWLVSPWSDVNIVVLSMFVVDLIGECIVSL